MTLEFENLEIISILKGGRFKLATLLLMEQAVQCLRIVRFYEVIDKFEVWFWVQYVRS